jgi:hypothetical protein
MVFVHLAKEEETNMKKWMVKVLAVVAVMTVASSVWAGPLLPGQDNTGASIVFNGSAPWGNPASLTLVANMTSAYSGGGLTGSVQTLVYREASGNLDFFYQVTSTSPDHALHMSIAGFGNTTTDAGYVTDPSLLPSLASNMGSVPYTDIYRIDPNVIGGNFTGGLANASTEWLAVHTNATSYGGATMFIQDGAQATAATFAPAPLPSSLALFATGAVGMVGGLFRRFRRNPR